MANGAWTASCCPGSPPPWQASPGDLVVVLHLLGNHGPAYSRRYPPEFRKFVPTCESLELSDCSQAEIVNAYDNAILYTDHVLAGIIRYLEAQTGRDAGLIYVSDHGESLGEVGHLPARPALQDRPGRAAGSADAGLAVRQPGTGSAGIEPCLPAAGERAATWPTTTCSTRCSACCRWKPSPGSRAWTSSPRAGVRP